MGGWGHTICICLTPVRGSLALTRNSIFKKNIDKSRVVHISKYQNLIVWGVNWVAMGRHGLILNHNEATGSRKVSGYLPDLWDTI